jgi:hypothetical protein
MTEVYKVYNPQHGPCSLLIYKPLQKEDGMTVHNYKRLLRSASVPVLIPANQSLDLVKKTGMTISELKNQKDLQYLINIRKLIVLQEPDSPIAATPVVESVPIASPVVVEEEKVEEKQEVVEEPEVVDMNPVEVETETNDEGREPTQEVKRHRGRPKKNVDAL